MEPDEKSKAVRVKFKITSWRRAVLNFFKCLNRSTKTWKRVSYCFYKIMEHLPLSKNFFSKWSSFKLSRKLSQSNYIVKSQQCSSAQKTKGLELPQVHLQGSTTQKENRQRISSRFLQEAKGSGEEQGVMKTLSWKQTNTHSYMHLKPTIKPTNKGTNNIYLVFADWEDLKQVFCLTQPKSNHNNCQSSLKFLFEDEKRSLQHCTWGGGVVLNFHIYGIY